MNMHVNTRAQAAAAALLASVALMTACGGSDDAAIVAAPAAAPDQSAATAPTAPASDAPAQSAPTPVETVPAPVETVPAPVETAPVETAPAAPTGYVMPNLVGANLQDAQDTIQQVTGNPIFITFSHDLLGSRSQMVDSNWQVCTQNVAAGTTFADDTRIDFGAVKLTENCP